ncbi:hypothetical protein CTheo_6260 [Ceratobasidium theobromae]|uniref:Uncharacterized protein n=1 Tax=Ceratobasidium theobromae TaxID=1582974 RepID=A0A5N5QFP9_9AGAM|nr:hypothetical protein CTheo_6260 [Ceratobasidium theobromae]
MASESPTWRLPANSVFHTNMLRDRRHDEDLISAYEAEEERITNVLSRKLEQLREEKSALESNLEAESEPHVNRLTRQIASLQSQLSTSTNGREPPQAIMLIDAMRLENAQLRSRVADLERDFLRVSRLNEIYRQELLEHRRRLGLPYESLIGLGGSASQSVSSSPADTFSQRRIAPSGSSRGHVNSSVNGATSGTTAVPIPRVQSQTRIHSESISSIAPTSSDSTPPSSPSYSLSPTAPLAHSNFFPGPSSHLTTLTTPASVPPITPLAATPLSPPLASTSSGQPRGDHTRLAHALTELATANAQRAGLSYPSVPPPSLASSLGSGSPVVPTLRVPPNSRRQSRGEWPGQGRLERVETSRGEREREGRAAETGSLRRREETAAVSIPARRRMSLSRGGAVDDELEEIGEAYSDEDEDVLEEDVDEEDYRSSGALEIGRGRGRPGGSNMMGLGLSGAR